MDAASVQFEKQPLELMVVFGIGSTNLAGQFFKTFDGTMHCSFVDGVFFTSTILSTLDLARDYGGIRMATPRLLFPKQLQAGRNVRSPRR